MTNMRRKRNDRGFTMIELLAVVAIIGILAGVGFAAVTTHQKNLARVERDAIAKEIFVAAQNHLTMAESQGYLGIDKTKFGTELTTGPEGSETGTGEYWIAYTGDATDFGDESNGDVTMLGLMLPFGSLDETVRAGGRYVIHYRPNPAVVLDVFYWTTDSRYGGEISSINYETLSGNFAGDAKASARRGNKPVMGWYGETASVTLESGKYLEMPSIEVINAERLIVKVKEPSANRSNSASLKLIVTGVTSGANAAIPLTTDGEPKASSTDGVKQDDGDNCLHIITLDDITTINMHFEAINGNKRSANINISGTFIPGENIVVKAVAYSSTALTNIAYSSEITTNSLFADLGDDETDPTKKVAKIANFRHLENLDKVVSGLQVGDGTSQLKLTNAEQIENLSKPETAGDPDLSWLGFVTAIKATKTAPAVFHVYQYDDTSAVDTSDDYYRPVNPDYALTYDGGGNSISGIKINTDTTAGVVYKGSAGLFGAPTAALIVQNLELIDFAIAGAEDPKRDAEGENPAVPAKPGNVGALAGTLPSGSSVTNVLARNTVADTATYTITTSSGSAGGLIGSMTSGTVSKSAAAIIVKNTGTTASDNAGGLIGTAAGGTITACYSGGHAKNNTTDGSVVYDSTSYNVTASAGTAGGLVGDAGSTNISYSYSTCSASGHVVGGFVGTSTGAISNCYATGLVSGKTKHISGDPNDPDDPGSEESAKEGAFAATLTGTMTNCQYFEIVNEREEKDASGNVTGYSYLSAVAVTDSNTTGEYENITALDASAASYNSFSGDPANWESAVVYDEKAAGRTSEENVPLTNATKLEQYYGERSSDNETVTARYNLKTVEQLAGTSLTGDNAVKDTDFVATHYGDWPAPEIFVMNEKAA